MRPLMLFIFLLGIACASMAQPPDPPEQGNLYQKFYTQLLAPPAATPIPRAYRGKDQDGDSRNLLEDGYDLLGYSAFEAGDVPPEQLMEQAANVHADLVLVYTKRNGTVTLNKTQKNGQDADESERLIKPQTPHYEYIASFWTKLPPPVLGLHVRDPGNNTVPGGLPVVAVVKDSPAASAEMQAGDLLLRIGDTEMLNGNTLRQATHRYAGQSVEIVFARASETISRTVVLNSEN